jgi:NADH-quinone oxidoreductase subunit G
VRTTFAALEQAPVVLLVGLEPEDEAGIVFLRLRKASRAGTRVYSVGAVATRGLAKMSGTLVPARPGAEASVLGDLDAEIVDLLAAPGAVILVGERAAGMPGALTAASRLADRTGAALAWIPRRAGERGALDAGALAGLLPGGRLLDDAAARAQVAALWGIEAGALPHRGRRGAHLVQAAASGRLRALIVGGVELADLPSGGEEAIDATPFVVSLEHHHSAVTARADVVLPVAVVTEKAGTFLNWEGRPRPFPQVFRDALTYSDAQVLAMISDAMGMPSPRDVAGLRSEMGRLGAWSGTRAAGPEVTPGAPAEGTVLATWHQALDSGAMQENEPYLAATARPTVAVVPAAQAAELGDVVTVRGPRGSVTLPAVAGDVVDGAVWLPLNSPGCHVYADLGVVAGDPVTIERGA